MTKLTEEEIADIEAAAYTAFSEGQRGPSEETLLRLRSLGNTCEHGKTIAWKGPPIAWAGGCSTCVCCQQWYGWISCHSYDEEGLVSSREPDMEHCQGCGGHDTVFERGDTELVEHSQYPRMFHRVRKLTTDEVLALLRAAIADGLELGTLRKLVERIPPDLPQRREAVLLVKGA